MLQLQGTINNAGNSLTLSGPGTVGIYGILTNSNGTLDLSGPGNFSLSGTIMGGTVSETDGAVLTSQAGTLDGVTLNGNLTEMGDGTNSSVGVLNIADGLTLNGTANLGSDADHYGRLTFNGSQTLNGTGTIIFGASGGNYLGQNGSNQTLTIGPNITILGQTGVIGGSASFGGDTVVNLGTISADTADGEFTVYDVDNTGIIENSNGGTVSFQGSWSSTSVLSASGSGMLQLQGTVNNAGNGLTLWPGHRRHLRYSHEQQPVYDLSGPGNFSLSGTIMGGTVGETDGAVLTSQAGTLDGVTLNGNLTEMGDGTNSSVGVLNIADNRFDAQRHGQP